MTKIKVQVLTETTVWSKVKNYAVPNHTYFINAVSKKLVAYIKQGTDEVIRMRGNGITFDRRGRTFNVKWRYI